MAPIVDPVAAPAASKARGRLDAKPRASAKVAHRKSWREKMKGGGAGAPHVVILPRPYCGAPAGGKLFIASPVLVDAYMRSVPRGETRTIEIMRRDLAVAYGADVCCPTSTSIFARIASEAALEELAAGAPVETVAPFWRVIDPASAVAGRLSCGRETVRDFRAAEMGPI